MKIKLPFLFLLFFSLQSFSQDLRSRALLKKMIDACDSVKSAKFILNSTEREDHNPAEKSELIIKLQTSPVKIYLYMIHPHAGAECIWRKGELSDRVLVNPNGFPFINLKLSPYNSLLRQDSHHLISDLGFEYITSMAKYYKVKLGESFYKYLHITDTIRWDNRTCYELTFDYTPFKYIDYTVKLNETLTTIAAQFHVSDYVLLKHNPKVNDYDAVKPGQVIQVPNFYNRKIIFYVDHQNFLPLVQITYDENGLLEKYEMKSFILNPSFQPEEFTPAFKGYGF
jgi:hypothetical protein